jgi:hypothetical protein
MHYDERKSLMPEFNSTSDDLHTGEPALFKQQYVRVNRQAAGGRLQAGPGLAMFLVIVRDSALIVIQAPATPVMQVPAYSIQIATPKLQRRLGTVTTLRIGEQHWGFDFTAIYQAERGFGFLRRVFSFGSIRRSTSRAREINKRFVAALIESGTSQVLRPLLQRGDAQFQLVDPLAQDLDLRFIGHSSFG